MKKALKMLVFGIIVWALCEGSSCAGEKWQLEKVSGKNRPFPSSELSVYALKDLENGVDYIIVRAPAGTVGASDSIVITPRLKTVEENKRNTAQ